MPWRSIEQAAVYVGLGENAFRAAVNRGEIAVIDDDGHRRFLQADLDAYLAWKRKPANWEQAPATETHVTAPGVLQLKPGINRLTGQPRGGRATS